jgi:three-Cys-motif partner protein
MPTSCLTISCEGDKNAMSDTKHEFGGDWTEVKLETISAYSQFFVVAIGKKFDLWYVDPFAGTGERTAKETSGGLFENEPISTIERQYPGSAARALSLEPPFAHLRLGDAKRKHVKALEKLAELHPNRDVRVLPGDANNFVQEMFSKPPWTDSDFTFGTPRALVFLDPYGMEVKWRTLEVLARCQKADVWFLANMKAAWQQLSRSHDKLDADKRTALREYFGTDDWEEKFYSTTQQDGLLGLMSDRTRSANKSDIAAFHHECLNGLFAYVSPPLPLKVGAIDDYFLLYCMSNNPSPAAQGLIKRGAEAVTKKYKQASRHRSVHPTGDQ